MCFAYPRNSNINLLDKLLTSSLAIMEYKYIPLFVQPFITKEDIENSKCTKQATTSRGRTYVMITYVSKENNLGPGDKIRYIWGLKGPIFIL